MGSSEQGADFDQYRDASKKRRCGTRRLAAAIAGTGAVPRNHRRGRRFDRRHRASVCGQLRAPAAPAVFDGAAVKRGAREAKGDIIVFMDADGQHDPADIARLIAKVDEGFDMVVGARDWSGQAGIGRGIANTIYNWLASRMTGFKVADLTSGFRAARADKFREFLHLLPNGFSYPTTSTMAFFRSAYTVTYVPIKASLRIGKSHIRPLRDGLRFLLIIFKIATLYSPLKLFVPASFAFFVLGLGYYLHTFVTIHRFTNMSMLLFSAAVIVFLIGLISEQITNLTYRK